MNNHTIDNLPDPTSVLQATHKKYVDKQMNPSHKTNQFHYLMTNTLEWSDLIPGGNGFNMVNICDLSPDQSYNHEVISTTIIKNA